MSQEGGDWYHGKLNRIDAENILLEESQISNADGIFLVRESSTTPNSYVLSVYFDSQFWHYQIHQHGEDAFFSVNGQLPIHHGLDGLVEHYKTSSTYLCTKLKNYVKKLLPPVETRRHGKKNLLHRATTANHLDVVKEMLKTPERNLDAKDESGMTACHLACKNRVNPEIMKLLIERGATLTSRDSAGNVPLHYACENQCTEIVELIVGANRNLIQSRNSDTGFVPLHFAAKAGNLEIVKFLLANKAPHMPRTVDGLFPKDFAKRNSGIIEFLNDYKPPITAYRNKWDHGTLDRKEAFRLLLQKREELYEKLHEEYSQGENPYVNTNKEKDELISGLFLVRLSERNNGYVITMLHNDEIKNYKIEKVGKYYCIDDGPFMLSIEHLISHYMEFADGLPVTLRYAVEPKPRPPVPLITPLKRKSIDISPSKPISPAATASQINVSNIPAESPNKSNKWMNSLPSMFRGKKKQIRSSLSKEEKSSTPDTSIVNSFKDLSFTTDLFATEISQESYDVPTPKKSLEPVDYFTESDKNNACSQTPMKDNCIEEIYFIDAPVVEVAPVETTEKQEWNNQLDVELYDTQKNLLKEVNQKTGANYYVSMNDLRVDREIGSGEFGNVLRGVLRLTTGKKIYVAVKTLHKEHYQENLSEFLREASVMIKLDNPYIVKLIGITKGPPLGLVQELLPLGSLATYLEDHADEVEERDMNLWASQIATGMEYLESKRFVHRDLAARNILLASKNHSKISDFGLSRAIGVDKDFYQSSTGGRWPLKWYAPENFYGTFSHASDVWSFGITLWEIYTKGQSPYGEMTGSEVNEIVEKGQRLPQPEGSSDEIYKIMMDCWQYRDRMRPNFQFLARFFINSLNNTKENVSEEMHETEDNEKHSNTVYV